MSLYKHIYFSVYNYQTGVLLLHLEIVKKKLMHICRIECNDLVYMIFWVYKHTGHNGITG